MANVRIIVINWTPVTQDPSVIGYNVYLVGGAPSETTRQLVAFVAGINTSSYTYTGIEGVQYEFEIRSTDGIVESPKLEVFYPNGTSLYTPTVITPTGKPMQIVRDQAYLSKDDFLNFPTGLKLTTASPLYTSGMLDNILQSASEQVNRYCHRHFNSQTIDEVYHGIRIGQDI